MKTRRIGILFGALACLVWAAGVHAGQGFTDHGDGTVTDERTGLMWSRTDNQGDIDWKGAQRWVRFTFPLTLPAEKQEGWRLPTLEELSGLFAAQKEYAGYESDCGQRVRIVSDIRLSCGWVWASESRNISARVFNFQKGYHYTDRRIHKRAYRALAVKSP